MVSSLNRLGSLEKKHQPIHKRSLGRGEGFGESGVRTLPKGHVFSKGILPIDQVVLESLSRDAVFGHEIRDWCPPDRQVGGWGLPSHGVSKETCGTFFMSGCLNISDHPDGQGVFKAKVHRCFSPKCPICWKSWCGREAGRISDRVKAWRGGRPIHYMVSPPRRLWGLDPRKLRRKAYIISKKTGFLGGSCIFHPFRLEIGSNRWYFSPHFHFIGYGWISGKKVAEIYASKGWISKNIGIRKTVFGTAYYQLTHAGVWYGENRRHSVTWFGVLSYNKLMIPKRVSKPVACPYCGSKMVTLIWIGEGDPPLPSAGIYLACADGWTTRMNEFWSNFAPLDWRSTGLYIDEISRLRIIL